jgi:hypothetical protein
MEFRLTYDGPLYATSNRTGRPDHKHEIRKAFHPRLKRFWEINNVLKERIVCANETTTPYKDWLATQFERCGYRFVPLVVERLSLFCAVDVLFLRPDPPGRVFDSGDIDGRLKTLFDALRIPRSADELGKYQTPGDGEDPMYCLVENDVLISKVTVETDLLLEPTGKCPGYNDARLIVGVKLRPYGVSTYNLDFV